MSDVPNPMNHEVMNVLLGMGRSLENQINPWARGLLFLILLRRTVSACQPGRSVGGNATRRLKQQVFEGALHTDIVDCRSTQRAKHAKRF